MIKLSFEKILINVIRVLICLTFFVPLIILKPVLFPHTFGKQIILFSIIEVIIFLYIILVIKNRKFLPRLNWLMIIVSLLILVFIYTTITSVDISRSFWGSMSWTNGLLLLLHLYLFFIVLITVFKQKKDWQIFFITHLIAGTFVILYALAQLLNLDVIQSGIQRLTSTLGNPIYLSIYEIFFLFTCLIIFFWKTHLAWKIYSSLFGLITLLLIVFKSGTRGAILGIMCGVIAMIFFVLLCHRKKMVKIISIAVLIAFVLIAVSGSVYLIKTNKILDLFTQNKTVKTRLISWKIGLQGFQEKIITGWGMENFYAPFEKYYDPEFYQQSEDSQSMEYAVEFPHNKLIELAVLNGIFALIIYLSLFGYIIYLLFKDYLKTRNIINVLLIGLLVSYFVQNLFVFDCLVSYLFFFFYLGFLHYWFYANLEDEREDKPLIDNQLVFNFFTFILILLFIYSIWFFAIRPGKASQIGGQGRVYLLSQYYNHSWQQIEKSREYKADIVNERMNVELAKGMLKNMSGKLKSNEAEVKYLFNTIIVMEENIRNHPYMLLNYTLLAQLYNIAGNFDPKFFEQAEKLSYIALENLHSKRIETYRNLSYTYLGIGEAEKAVDTMQKAIDLNSDFGYSYHLMSFVYNQLNNKGKELEYMLLAMKYNYLSKVSADNILFMLKENNDYVGLAEASKEAILRYPNQVNYYYSLGQAYLELDAKDYVRETAQKILNRFPQSQQLANDLLNKVN